jgi:hypothetical protein
MDGSAAVGDDWPTGVFGWCPPPAFTIKLSEIFSRGDAR